MSAIFGLWYKNGRPIVKDQFYKMRDSLIHYGTDAQEVSINSNLALGCCLNKVNLYSQNDMPIYRRQNNNLIFIADAQIYNRDELIKQYHLSVNSDISNNELLLEAYLKWGVECPNYVNGDFAFVVWDHDKLIAVRDHLGVRPLYYYADEEVFAFATDYRALLVLPFLPKNINDKRMYDIFINHKFMDIENTWFENIKKVLPAHVLQINRETISTTKYWTPGSGKKIIYKTEEEYFQALYDVINKAIEIRINCTEYKIGAQMSGGLDSSVINILANRELFKNNKKLSLLFSWSPSFDTYERLKRDERNFIEQICEQENLECLYYDFNSEPENENDSRIKMPEERTYKPMRQELNLVRSRNIRLMLSGWGGDEGISHRAGLFELFVNGYWKHYFKEVISLSKGSVLRFAKILLSSTILQLFRPLNYLHINNNTNDISNKAFHKSYRKYRKKSISYFSMNPVKNIEAGPLQTRTEISAWMGADYNVQYLFPFLDYHVIDFAMSIPKDMFYKNGINRYAFRKAFESILPKELCYYTPKDDIARTTYSFSRLKDSTYEEDLLMNKLSKTLYNKYIDFEKAQKLLNDAKQGNKEHLKIIISKQLSICYNIQKLLETL